jgi:hypothetical protein
MVSRNILLIESREMIPMPRTVHELMAGLIATLPLVVFVPPCIAAEPTTIDTRGFSITFGERWHVSTIYRASIFAEALRGDPTLAIVRYADDSMNNELDARYTYDRMKHSSIEDVTRGHSRDMAQEAKWSRHDNVHRPDGIEEERLELEDKDEECLFDRFYHGAPHAELYIAFLMKKPCDEARAEFDEIVNSIVWK